MATFEITNDYSIWMNKFITLQQLVIDVSNSVSNNIDISDFSSSLLKININKVNIYDDIDYKDIPNDNEILEVPINDYINERVTVDKNINIDLDTMDKLIVLCDYILSFFLDADTIPYYNTNGKSKQIKIKVGKKFKLLGINNLVKYIDNIIEYLQDIDLSKGDKLPIPYINCIPRLESIYSYKTNINKLLNNVSKNIALPPSDDELIRNISSYKGDDGYELLTDIIKIINENTLIVDNNFNSILYQLLSELDNWLTVEEEEEVNEDEEIVENKDEEEEVENKDEEEEEEVENKDEEEEVENKDEEEEIDEEEEEEEEVENKDEEEEIENKDEEEEVENKDEEEEIDEEEEEEEEIENKDEEEEIDEEEEEEEVKSIIPPVPQEKINNKQRNKSNRRKLTMKK